MPSGTCFLRQKNPLGIVPQIHAEINNSDNS